MGPISAALENTGVQATMAVALSRFSKYASDGNDYAAGWIGMVCLGILTQTVASVVSPTIAVVFLLHVGDCTSWDLNLSRQGCALVVVFGSNLCFANPAANVLHVMCMEAGQYSKRRAQVFGLF